MVKIPLIEMFIRLLPEGFLFMFAAYVLTRASFDRKKYMVSVILLTLGGFLVRSLPIHNGIHSILILVLFIILLVYINKISVIKAIRAGVITMLIMFISEGINVAIIQFILKKDVNVIFKDSILKNIYGIPSLIIFFSVVALYYFSTARKKMCKNICDNI
ncbi:hypothetical protein NBE98_06435 [Clostridium swellfunianum]|uniref:hypothetical protein n=1 Tax=Clostridium swellfunianum TaxID=1367462 RepID=UPI00202E6F1F|nr:hypothetical protein [Clostridium swellfunianum]MCM0648008.1 hypothetical protein [Clostridium swellfunianum]